MYETLTVYDVRTESRATATSEAVGSSEVGDVHDRSPANRGFDAFWTCKTQKWPTNQKV